MFRIIIALSCLAVSLAVFPPSISAQNRPYALTVSPMIGGIVFEGNQGLKDSGVFSLAAGYNFTERFSAEGVLSYLDTTTSRTPAVDVRGYSGRLDLLYHFRPRQKLVPFAALGFGANSYEAKGGGSDEDLLAGYGLGAKYYLTENLALRADARHIFHINVNDTNNSRDGYHNLLYSVGLHFQLGGVRPERPAPARSEAPTPVAAPAPVAADMQTAPPAVVIPVASMIDSDGDGVPDHLDRCPHTPWGEVDEHGCPRDDDGDGVPNYLDRCPDTPPGTKVDAWGCSEPLRLDLTFLPRAANIDPRHHAELTAIADTIRRAPAGTVVRIEGHTDSVGSDLDNLRLSQQRANAVRDYLIQAGIAPARLRAEGFGQNRPVADNASQKGREQNRRVTIQLLSNQ